MDYENDDIQIHEFIESVEPDYRYAGTEGYAQAMVEAVENYAIIEEYLTEADKNEKDYSNSNIRKDNGQFAKKEYHWNPDDTGKKEFKNKEGMISKFFGAIFRFIKAAIAKVKGFFATLRRKLTVLMAKGAQKISSFINRNVNLTDIGDSEFEVKKFNETNLNRLLMKDIKKDNKEPEAKSPAAIAKSISAYGISYNEDDDTFEVAENTNNKADMVDENVDKLKDALDDYKDACKNVTDDLISNTKEELVYSDEVTLNGRNIKSYYDTHNKKLLKSVDKCYSEIMKNFNKQIKGMQKSEKSLRKASHKTVTTGLLTRIRYAMKFQNVATKAAITMKYKTMQGIASASLAVYKSGLWAALKALGARGAHAVKTATESTHVDLLDRIQ